MRHFELKVLILIMITVFMFYGCSKKDKQNETIPIPEEEIDIVKLVNVNMPGWRAGIERVINYEQGLRLYAGRTADLYLAYGFKKFAIKEYKNRDSLSIMVEVYDFGNSENAYGIYSFDTTGSKMDIGNDATYSYGILKFWKGHLFVRIVAQEEYRQLEKSIIQFARAIDQRITAVGERPQLLEKIPQEKMVPDTLHFFHENSVLNNIYYIPESYTLGLSDKTDVVTAQYSFAPSSYPRLFVIEYPDELSAQNAYNAFTVRYYDVQTPVYRNDLNVVRTEEDDYNSISIKKNFVILVFESHSSEINKKLTKEVSKRID